MTIGTTGYERFRALHERTDAFIMPNAWDVASAVLLERAGFETLGSASLGLAFSLDGRTAGMQCREPKRSHTQPSWSA